MTNPAISVIMGAYNAEPYLRKAIESILHQSFRDFEFIIIDDGSKDNTGKIIDEYAAKDNRIVAIHHDNMGHANSLNKALGLAKAPLIARMDADDIALPERFAKQIEFLNNHPEISVLGTSITLIDDQDNVIRDIPYPTPAEKVAEVILDGSPLAHPTVMMRKQVLEEMGGYRANLDPAEDYDLWLRISEKYPITNLPEIHLLYRHHSTKLSIVNSQYGTLSTILMQMASKLRREGKPDPLAGSGKITAETLKLFDLTKEQEIELLYKTYHFILYSLVESCDDKAVPELFAKIDATYSKEYAAKIKYLACIFLFNSYYDKKRYKQAYYYLLKTFPDAPSKVIPQFARCLIRQFMPYRAKRILKKLLGRS